MNTNDAFKQVRQFAKYAEALAVVCDQADALAQSENTMREHEAKVANLKAETERINVANYEARGIARQTIDAANAEAAQIRADAANAKAQAEEEAKDIVTKAKGKAAALAANADQHVANAEAQANEAIARRDAAQNELDDITKRLEKAQAQVNKLLGG